MYLPLAEATVLNFLAPIGACCAVTFISTGSFSSMEILSWVMSLTGVVLIVQPEFLFGSPPGVASFKIEAAHIGIAFAIMGAVGGMVCSIKHSYYPTELILYSARSQVFESSVDGRIPSSECATLLPPRYLSA